MKPIVKMRKTLYEQLESRFNELQSRGCCSDEEAFVADFKYTTGKAISYKEFVTILNTGDEIFFYYDGLLVEFVAPATVTISPIENNLYQGGSYEFPSIQALLEDFKINGETIEDFWSRVEQPIYELILY